MKQRGFTLIEMLIALMIGIIVAASLTLITRSMAQSAQNEQMIVEASQAARAGIDMLRFDFMRAGMFYAANPRSDVNTNSLVSIDGTNGGTHHAYYRNPIVHLNAGGTGPDTIVLVGNFIGDREYEGEVDIVTSEITIRSSMAQGMCEREFNSDYAFAHLTNATGQTHEVKVAGVTPPQSSDCDNGFCTGCVLAIAQGELISGAFGERNVKVAANQAAVYRVEQLPNSRGVLMRYFIDYDGATDTGLANVGNLINAAAAQTAVVIAENVVDFQVWFRPINPAAEVTAAVADQPLYINLSSSGVLTTIPQEQDEIVGKSGGNNHLPSPTSANLGTNLVFPEHVRSAIISIAVRTEKTDQFQGTGTTTGQVVSDELAGAPADDVGNYKLRRFTVEVKLPNIQSQMALFQNATIVL